MIGAKFLFGRPKRDELRVTRKRNPERGEGDRGCPIEAPVIPQIPGPHGSRISTDFTRIQQDRVTDRTRATRPFGLRVGSG